MKIEKIITHPGGAHKDDLLACSIMVAVSGAVVLRREPTEGELEDPAVCVIDVGHRHQPELSNFDHHQFPRDHVPTCALSLVLMHLGLYEDARLFCDWLEPAEWFDSRGPKRTAEFLKVPRQAVSQLNSPVDMAVLTRFSASTKHEQEEPIYEIMAMVGEDLLSYLRGVREKMDLVSEHSERWTMEKGEESFGVLYMPRGSDAVEDASGSMARYVLVNKLEREVAVLVYPDSRGEGFGMARFNDHPRMDFKRVEDEDDVHFAHASGFLAKTSAREPGRLKELVAMGWG